jgi:hypothetical protein
VDPDPEGPKTCGSGSRFGSATLVLNQVFLKAQDIFTDSDPYLMFCNLQVFKKGWPVFPKTTKIRYKTRRVMPHPTYVLGKRWKAEVKNVRLIENNLDKLFIFGREGDSEFSNAIEIQ